MKPPRPHPLIVRASALARLRGWPTVWSLGRQACLALGATTRLTGRWCIIRYVAI